MRLFIVFFLVSCSQIKILNKEGPLLKKEKKEDVTLVLEEDTEQLESTVDLGLVQNLDLVFLGSGFESFGLSQAFKKIEDQRRVIDKIIGKGFGAVLAESYKKYLSSNMIDWVVYKYFKDVKNSDFISPQVYQKEVYRFIDDEFKNKEVRTFLKNENAMMQLGLDYSAEDCLNLSKNSTNETWCFISGVQDRVIKISKNLTMFELSAGLINKDSLVDILEQGKIFFRESFSKER